MTSGRVIRVAGPVVVAEGLDHVRLYNVVRVGRRELIGEVIRLKGTEAVIQVNETVKRRMIEKIRDLCDGSFNGKKIAIFGVTFKPNTDDMRDAPSLTIVPALIGSGAKVHAVDPQGRHEGEALLPHVVWESDAYDAAKDADLIVILTEWNEFRALDLPRLAGGMSTPRMADLRNIYSAEDATSAGFEAYESVGRRGYPDTPQ